MFAGREQVPEALVISTAVTTVPGNPPSTPYPVHGTRLRSSESSAWWNLIYNGSHEIILKLFGEFLARLVAMFAEKVDDFL